MPHAKPVALVTGASRGTGLGYEVGRQLAARGFAVMLTARDATVAEAQAARLRGEGSDAYGGAVDVTADASVERLVGEIRATFGRLDVLVNNAGGYYDAGGQPLDTELEFAAQAVELNLFGAWRTAKAFVPLLLKSDHPRIVNVSSGAGSFADPQFGLGHGPQGTPAYGISKLALNGLTVKLAVQLKAARVLVNSVCPGFVATFPGLEQYGARPVADGAASIVWAATLPDDGPTGGFFRDGQPIGW